jgi:phosphate:Na+ symporter
MLVLINILSGIALLVWATHLVRKGILRVFGANLYNVLRHGVANKFTSICSGLFVTSLLQSSTATCLIVASFVPQGAITLSQALLLMLGADIGSSLIAVFFSFNLAWLSSIFIFFGVILFISKQGTKKGQIGRIFIGLGLISLALQLISQSVHLLIQSEIVKHLLLLLPSEILLDIFVGAVFTVLSYSSLAVVLLTTTLVISGALPMAIGLGIVLGANLGSGLLAFILTSKSGPEIQRVAVGNLICRLSGVILLAPLIPYISSELVQINQTSINSVILFHLCFNILLALLFVWFTANLENLLKKIVSAAPKVPSEGDSKYLDPVALDTPSLAIGCAIRESLHQADVVEKMLLVLSELTRNGNSQLVSEVHQLDNYVDNLYNAIKFYLAKISREALSDSESKRWTDIISFTIALEQIGDAVERTCDEIDEKNIKKLRQFSEAGLSEISELFEIIMQNFRLSTSVFLNQISDDAHRLLNEKANFKNLEREYSNNHLTRLQEQSAASMVTSSLHLDLLNEFRRINSLICSVAYSAIDS